MIKFLAAFASASVGGCNAGSLVAPNLSDTGSGSGSDGSVLYRINLDGKEQTQENGNPINDEGTWIGSCANTEYEAMITVVSGDNPEAGSSAIDSWLLTSSTRTWSLQSANPADKFGTWRIRIRRISNNAVLLDKTFTMDANSGPP